MSNGIILGAGGDVAHDETEPDAPEQESRRVYVTNFFSFGHLVPWGGLIDVRRLSAEEVKTSFEGKRVDLFAWPDVELMRDILQQQAIVGGQIPQGSQEEHEAAFCQMVNVLVEQCSGCHVRAVQKPKPVKAGRRYLYVQLYLPQASVLSSGGGIGSVWWEISPKEIRNKPEASK